MNSNTVPHLERAAEQICQDQRWEFRSQERFPNPATYDKEVEHYPGSTSNNKRTYGQMSADSPTQNRPVLPDDWPSAKAIWDSLDPGPMLAKSYAGRLSLAFVAGKHAADDKSIREFIHILKLCWEPGVVCKQLVVPKYLSLWLLEEGVIETLWVHPAYVEFATSEEYGANMALLLHVALGAFVLRLGRSTGQLIDDVWR